MEDRTLTKSKRLKYIELGTFFAALMNLVYFFSLFIIPYRLENSIAISLFLIIILLVGMYYLKDFNNYELHGKWLWCTICFLTVLLFGLKELKLNSSNKGLIYNSLFHLVVSVYTIFMLAQRWYQKRKK